MNHESNQKALREILLWQQIGCIVVRVAQKLQISNTEALRIFYTSDTCVRLHDERTGLYLRSDIYLADEVILEYSAQTIKQANELNAANLKDFAPATK